MRQPLQMTFRHVDPSPVLEDRIRDLAGELDRSFGRIIACRVVIESEHRRHNHGNLHRVRIDLTVPGGEIVVGREAKPQRAHQDVFVAVRDAFDAARRRLEEHARVRRGDVKLHVEPVLGG